MYKSGESPVAWSKAGDGIFHITLNRAPANALGPPIIDGINAALDEADTDGTVQIIVVSSAIQGYFAAGADIKHMSAVDAPSFTAYGDALRAVLGRLAAPERISIAAVDGMALGGGLELAIACTLRVGGAGAWFGLPEVKLGLIPGAGGTQRLPRLVGRGHALEMMLTARQLPADEAHAIGLIDRLAAEGEAEHDALGLAEHLRGLSLPAQQAVVRTVDASFDMPLDEGLAYEVGQVQGLFEEGEAKEGISAFLERRSPNFGHLRRSRD